MSDDFSFHPTIDKMAIALGPKVMMRNIGRCDLLIERLGLF